VLILIYHMPLQPPGTLELTDFEANLLQTISILYADYEDDVPPEYATCSPNSSDNGISKKGPQV
jgi:hypothetical protein